MATSTASSVAAIQAAINVSVVQSRRLISSWLPPPTPQEIASQKTDEQLAKEDAELFKPMPPRLGLGAPIPKDFLDSADPKARRQAISTNEHLKRKIMGRTKPSSSNQEASKPRPRSGNDQPSTKNDDEDDEEEGRSSLGKPKRQKIGKMKTKEKNESKGVAKEEKIEDITEGVEKDSKLHSSADKESTKSSPKGPTRLGTYLDVHKAEKAKKKKKKKKQLAN
ncbi:hypothetical protein DFP73DRAFT_576495 [Morchella snyderi]|nr:hypothetical protein DFP73DRAFT_576495 [Morchella snyderi]